MADHPENLLCEIRAELVLNPDLETLRAEFATKSEMKAEIHSLRADVASDLLMDAQGAFRAVIEYHTPVISHGMPFRSGTAC